MANIKCKYCNKVIKDEPYKYKTANYCGETCAKLHEKQKKNRRDLTDYIQKIYLENSYEKDEINWTLITSMLKNIQQEHKDWNDAQIRYVLYYMYEIIQVNLFDEKSNGSILALLPFYFNEARDFCKKQKEIKDAVNEFEFDDEVIKIKRNNEEDELYLNDLSFD